MIGIQRIAALAAAVAMASLFLGTTPEVFAAEAAAVPVVDDVAPPNRSRPRVGLVLGGGGARGAAHVGVLRELENMRVPIDVIVGTSMGAIVGGLYASGVSVDELEETVKTMDWAAALADRSERRDLSFRRKKDDEQFPISFELGYRDGEFQLPQGVIPGHKLDLVLRELTLHASSVTDFDDLPIPFRAIASDMVAGEPYVMGDGDLATAIRASMSVPAAFAPVIIDGRLLVDGGLVGNLGVDVVQDIGVDVIIAVDVEFPLYDFEQLDSAVAISEQMITLLIRKETRRQIERLGPRDVLIQPDLGVFGSTNFAAAEETIEPGAAATRAAADRLGTVAVSEEDYAAYTAARTRLEVRDEPLAFVRVTHDAKVSSEILATRIDVEAGDPVDAVTLSRAADRLNGLRLFERVGYKLVEEGGETGVEFDARSKSWGPNFLRFGVSLEEDFEGSTAFNLSTRWRRPELNELGAEWLTDLQLGTDPLFATEYYQPLRFDSRVFVAPAMYVSQTNRNGFFADETVARLRVTEGFARLDVGAEIGTAGEFRSGIYRGGGEARVKVGDPSIPNFDFDSGGVLTRLRFDTFDNAQFPRRGLRTSLTWNASRRSLGADTNFDTLEFNFDGALSRGKSTLVAGINYATTHESIAPLQNYFQLGGLLRLSGLERGQLSGPHYGLARLVYFRQIGDSTNSLLAIPVYAGASIEAGNVWQTRDAISLDSLTTNGSLFLGLDTPIGPVYLAAGFAEQGRTNVYLFIGATPR